jgi:hypothetical protein
MSMIAFSNGKATIQSPTILAITLVILSSPEFLNLGLEVSNLALELPNVPLPGIFQGHKLVL